MKEFAMSTLAESRADFQIRIIVNSRCCRTRTDGATNSVNGGTRSPLSQSRGAQHGAGPTCVNINKPHRRTSRPCVCICVSDVEPRAASAGRRSLHVVRRQRSAGGRLPRLDILTEIVKSNIG
ncbi:hypothetical protein EVAR_55893_1 [Eumeta japonica]|uniref:Uncharacterized protein n=1 Tax=Eumeta variegata TaxID=151549 RepID=A0A4C1YM47_EUMVA|nr:hypothetical protein EVAR_55893_1 [Eumeta japonica]